MKSAHLQSLATFIESINLFLLIPKSKIMEMTTKCQAMKYPSNTIILKQGVQSSAFYMIRSGKIKVIRMIPFRFHPILKEKIRNDCSDPSQEEIMKGQYQNEFLEIDELSNLH